MKLFRSLLLIAATALAVSASAQQSSFYTQPGEKSYWGLRAGLDISCPSNSQYYNTGAGGHLGMVFNQPVAGNFYIEPGLMFYYDTWAPDSGGMVNSYEGDSYRQFGMRVPLMFGYHYPFNQFYDLTLFSGPMLDVGIDNQLHDKNTGRNVSMYSDREGFNRVNCTWNVGVGFSAYDVYFNITGAFGMTNMNKRSPYVQWNMNTIMIGVGYNI